MRQLKYFWAILPLFFWCFLQAETLRVGSKNFTEQLILGEMASLYFESKGLSVDRRLNLAGSHFTFEALKNGSIDIYPEYTGTGYITILKQQGESSPQKVFQIVRQAFKQRYNLTWSPPIGFNNSYVLATQQDHALLADKNNISELSDIMRKLTVGAPPEFFERSDGFPGLLSVYQLKHPKNQRISLDPGLMYQAVDHGEIDLISAFSTDPRIEKYQLKTLKDDRSYFPPYQAAWLLRSSLAKNPVVQEFFSVFTNLISDSEMRSLNAQVDQEQLPINAVALRFLQSKGIINNTSQPNLASNPSFFEYISARKVELWSYLKQHIFLTFIALTLAFVFGLLISIMVIRFKSLETMFFTLLNTMQTIPSIALLGALIPLVGIGSLPAIIALFFYSILPIARSTVTGIQSIEKSLVEVAQVIGMSRLQLFRYVYFPLAIPFIVSGLRTATVICIGTATLAALIGAGGLGDPIFKGIGQANNQAILMGAIPAALLAIFADTSLALLQKYLQPAQANN